MSLPDLGLLLLGLLLLVAGAELLVRGAVRLAGAWGVSPLVVGLTVVAFGTSAPELAVSLSAAWRGQAGADLALGNVVGSNIFNVLLILGLSAAITPLVVAQKLVRVDVPLMIGVSLLVLLLALDGAIGRGDGLLLFAGIVAYSVFAVVHGRREADAVAQQYADALDGAPAGGPARHLGLVLVGLVLLVLGARWLVHGATGLARGFGVSELVIGLTVVAGGTSLPEVATSVVASLRGQRDIAVGNVVGSNLFNLLGVLGLSGLAAPDGLVVIDSVRGFDLPVMIAAAIACLPIYARGRT
ncbi:MAG TPA: calcium/sodium antiporter, partial [Gammaproteobacteria bacterium]